MARPVVHHLQNTVLSAAQLCNNASEAIELFEERGLFLKPIAKLNVSVTLPQLKTPGKSLSNWEVMEKLKRMAQPDQFLVLRVSKSSLEFLRFEAEVEAKSLIKTLIARMDGKSIKLSGFSDTLKVRAAEARIPFPVRHDWDSFFRDAKGMNEANPGERPDTIHLENLPCRWFATKSEPEIPSENIIRRVFQTFGELRQIDVPMLDPYRHENQITGGNFRTFNPFSNQLTFEGYVQFKEYIGFVKAMDSLKGMKLMRKTEDKAYTAELKISFDKTKHLCAKSIRKREKERQRLLDLEKQREEAKRLEREEEERKIENERIKKEKDENHRRKRKLEKLTRRKMRQLEREEKRRLKREDKKRIEHEQDLQRKIQMEERKLVLAQRRLESIRLLTELLERAKIIQQQNEVQKKLVELEDERVRQVADEKQRKEEAEKKKKRDEERRLREMARREAKLKERLTQNLEKREEKRKEVEREELRQQMATRPKRLKSAVVMTTTTKKISGELTPPGKSSPVEVFNKKTGKWMSIYSYSGIHF